MAEEEFQESEVIFSEEMVLSNNGSTGRGARSTSNEKKRKKKKKKNASAAGNSVPVNINIPDNIFQYVDTDDQFEEEYEDGEIVPPHVVISRRIAAKMAFSVCTGNGRTLKGRDLSQVRNSILRMTGFLET